MISLFEFLLIYTSQIGRIVIKSSHRETLGWGIFPTPKHIEKNELYDLLPTVVDEPDNEIFQGIVLSQ